MKGRVTQPPDSADVRTHAVEAAGFLKALANEQRLRVLCALLGGPRSVGEINASLSLSQSALSQHLRVLRAAGILTSSRRSQTVHYALAPGPSLAILEVLNRAYCAPGAGVRGAGRRGAARRRDAGRKPRAR